MTIKLRVALVVAGLAAAVGCSGGGAPSIAPVAARSASPAPGTSAKATATPAPTPTATPNATVSGMPNIAALTTALQSVQTYYATLPHQNSQADLAALAAEMVSSKTFSSATVTYGGITATTADGTPAVVFADHPEALGYASGSAAGSAAIAARARATPQRDRTLSGPSNHEIAFLINELDTSGAFSLPHETAFAQAFQSVGNAGASYNVDVLDASLDNVRQLSVDNIDYLSINTHGMVAGTSPNLFYLMASTTSVNAVTTAQYLPDYLAGNIVASLTVQYPTSSGSLPQWAFTPGFLTSHLSFNPGAIVDNESCFGQSPATIDGVKATLSAHNVGRYIGWTKEVAGPDSDQTVAFILDRLLGEQNPSVTKLDQLVPQRSPAQRPFPLDDIQGILAMEDRSGSLGTGFAQSSEPYSESNWSGNKDNPLAPPLPDGTKSVWMFSDLGGESVASPPDEYGFPSISKMAMTSETATGGTLDISGRFPAAPGTVRILDETGATTLTPLTWSTSDVTVALPASGAGSKGEVQVYDADGAGSNFAPLTQWQGSIIYTEGDQLSGLAGQNGSGTGGISLDFELTFRSDVHPTVPAIDTSPVPQNLYFPQVEGNSTATVTSLNGNFTSVEGTPPPATAAFSLNATTPMSPQNLPLSTGTFIVGAVTGQPAPCNDGVSGPQGPSGNVFCPGFGYVPAFVGSCAADPVDSGLCGDYGVFSPSGSFGAANLLDPAIVQFTMDTSAYTIAVSAPDTQFTRPFHGSSWPASASVTGTVGPPAIAPNDATPAFRVRGGNRPGT